MAGRRRRGARSLNDLQRLGPSLSWLGAEPAQARFALPVAARLLAVAADVHRAPGAGVVAGGVVEGPLAVVVGAGLEARPGAVALEVLDRQQQAGLEAAEAGAGGGEFEPAVGGEGGPDPGALGGFAQRRRARRVAPPRRCWRASAPRSDSRSTLDRRRPRSSSCPQYSPVLSAIQVSSARVGDRVGLLLDVAGVDELDEEVGLGGDRVLVNRG